MSISNQTTDQIDHEVGDTAVTGMFDLGNVLELLELIDDSLNE